MPLPLPDLDTRTWGDLVDEARALIPRYAPDWTDHNLHDPGMTLIDLLAWLVEMDVYALDRVPEASRRRFLALVGGAPRPPQAATAVAWLSPPGPTSVTVPAGIEIDLTLSDQSVHRFVAGAGVEAAPLTMPTFLVQPGPSAAPQDAARFRREGGALAVLGDDPVPGAALWLGFNQSLPVNHPVRLHIALAGGRSGWEEHRRIEAELAAQAESCRPPLPPAPACASPVAGSEAEAMATAAELLRHHSARLAWEFDPEAGPARILDAEAGEIVDDTRDFSLDGFGDVTIPAGMATQAPAGGLPRAFLRARLDDGDYDAPPLVTGVVPNAIPLRQAVPATSPFLIVPSVVVTGSPPALPAPVRLGLTLDPSGAITRLAFSDDPEVPELGVLAYRPASAGTAGMILLELARLGRTDGVPSEWFPLPGQMVAGDELEVYTLEGTASPQTWQEWEVRPDWGASSGPDRHVVLDRSRNRIVFPDGHNGHINAAGVHVLIRVRTTDAQAANAASVRAITLPPTLRNWALVDPSELANQLAMHGVSALLQQDLSIVWEAWSPATFGVAAASLASLAVAVPPGGAAAAETVAQAAARAVADLAAPTRAITAPDIETLALATPGTQIARVRALLRQHPALPCLVAPGLVTVVVVPAQRRAKPQPSAGLLATVRSYLERRRLVGTQIIVVGPSYLTVGVTARVRIRPGASPDRVRADIEAALRTFLEPLTGGPAAIAATAKRPAPEIAVVAPGSQPPETDAAPALPPFPPGWPFGRDVYRTEVLQVIDGVPGVDHVLSLELSGDGGAPQRGNLCVGPTQLATAGPLAIEVVR